jgi:hypothetical protein
MLLYGTGNLALEILLVAIGTEGSIAALDVNAGLPATNTAAQSLAS